MNRQTRQNTPKNLVSDLIFQQECYAILGACFEVYKDKGCGFHEPVYQECLGIEFEPCRIPAIPQPGLSLEYRGKILNQQYFPDFVCFGKVIVELKSVVAITDEHRAQVLNYLKAGAASSSISVTTLNWSTSGSSRQIGRSILMNHSIFDDHRRSVQSSASWQASSSFWTFSVFSVFSG